MYDGRLAPNELSDGFGAPLDDMESHGYKVAEIGQAGLRSIRLYAVTSFGCEREVDKIIETFEEYTEEQRRRFFLVANDDFSGNFAVGVCKRNSDQSAILVYKDYLKKDYLSENDTSHEFYLTLYPTPKKPADFAFIFSGTGHEYHITIKDEN